MKARIESDERIHEALAYSDITITKTSERTQYDTYFMFDDPALGRVRYREDHRHDAGARLDPKSTLTLTVPVAERDDYPSAFVLSRARYTAPADRSLRFYREYFGADQVVEIEKHRRRWRILYNGVDFAINVDRLIDHPEPGPYLEIKSRTWSKRDAGEKVRLIDELLALFGVDKQQLVRLEYIELPGANTASTMST